MQSITKSNARRPTSILKMTSPTTFKTLIFLHCILLLNPSTVPKSLSYSHTYGTGTLIEYTMQNITNQWIELANAAGMEPLSRNVSSDHMFNRTRGVFEALSRKADDFVPRAQNNDLAKATFPLSKKKGWQTGCVTYQQSLTRRCET